MTLVSNFFLEPKCDLSQYKNMRAITMHYAFKHVFLDNMEGGKINFKIFTKM